MQGKELGVARRGQRGGIKGRVAGEAGGDTGPDPGGHEWHMLHWKSRLEIRLESFKQGYLWSLRAEMEC